MNNQVKVASGLNILAGIWLILSPFILGYSYITGALWNDIIIGAAVLILAAVREWGKTEETTWASWVNLVLGIWLIIAPFVIGYSAESTPLWNDVLLGILVAALAGWSGSAAPVVRRGV